MDGTVSLGGVGAVATGAQIQAAASVQAAAKTIEVTENLGASALKLIQASFVPVNTGSQHDLDVLV